MSPRASSRADRTEQAVEELRAATNQEAFKLRAELLQYEQRFEATEQALADLKGEFTKLREEIKAEADSRRVASKKKRTKADYSEEEIVRLRAEKARTRRAAQLKKQSGRPKRPAKGTAGTSTPSPDA